MDIFVPLTKGHRWANDPFKATKTLKLRKNASISAYKAIHLKIALEYLYSNVYIWSDTLILTKILNFLLWKKWKDLNISSEAVMLNKARHFSSEAKWIITNGIDKKC